MNLIFVCGPARSGTSAVTELITRMGASELPKTVVGMHNPDYHENVIINALAEAIHPWHKVTDVNPLADHLVDAMALYILEHQAETLVVKSPAFPFILDQLNAVAERFAIMGVEVETLFIMVQRDLEANAQSLDEFTGGVWDLDHWRRVVTAAWAQMSSGLWYEDPNVFIKYEDLLDDWRAVASELSKYPGLSMPKDGGIRPELNHHQEAEHAA